MRIFRRKDESHPLASLKLRRSGSLLMGRDELTQIRDGMNKLTKRVQRIESKLIGPGFQKIDWNNLRVGIFVDVQNMFYGAKNLFGARLDYVKLLHRIIRGRRLIKASAYVIENPEIDQSGFVSLLERHSFEVHKKTLIQRADGSQKGDWDMEIALDILGLMERIDVVALVSGDGDFISLVKFIKANGPRVEVYSFQQNTAMELKEIADEFCPIGDELIFKQREDEHTR